jgi:uncharacterized protein (TIGR00730 family)
MAEDLRARPSHEDMDRFIIDRMERDQSWRMFRIMGEFVEGFDRLAPYDSTVTVYGSSRARPGQPAYDNAELLGRALAEAGFTVVTGGGPGVMEAANKGASEAGGTSIGLAIDIPGETPNSHSNVNINFHYFFVRKVMLVWRATGFVLMPGGLGTLDELFETATLMATEKLQPFPVVLFGSDYWEGLVDWLRRQAVSRGFIGQDDIDRLVVTDDVAEVARLMKASGRSRS